MQIGTPSEEVTRRYHMIRVLVTLSVVGGVTLLLGIGALFNPEILHPVRYAAACFLVSLICGVLALLLRRREQPSTDFLELTMIVGLVATYANTLYGGLLGGDPWWLVCGYCIVILIAAGVSLRRWRSFSTFIVVALVAWVLIIENQGLSSDYVVNTYILIGLGTVTAAAILLMFRFERLRITSLNDELLASANRDHLTGILNRNGLLASADAAFAEALVDGDRLWCAYVDVNYFKSINDRFGHDHGDEVLRKVAAALGETGAKRALSARWGGDEFVLLGVGTAPDEGQLEGRLNRKLGGGPADATVSVGVARQFEPEPPPLAELLKAADHRMYSRRAAMRSRADAAAT